jgi:membrane fusion protein
MSGEAPPVTLFRREAVEQRADRLHGDINLMPPVSWQIVGFGLFAAFATLLLFLSLGSYTRSETVRGRILPVAGVSAVAASRTGTIARVMAREGTLVRAGEPLVEISTEETLQTGSSAQAEVLNSLAVQESEIAAQMRQINAAGGAQQARLARQGEGLEAEIRSLDEQVRVQRALIRSAEASFQSVEEIASRGYISKRELQAREDALLSRRQQLSALEQQMSAKRSALAELREAEAQTLAESQLRGSDLAAARAQIAQRRTAERSLQGYTIIAPISGRVTSVAARAGEYAEVNQPLLAIVPAGSSFAAELIVPNHAAGAIKGGQEVRLAIDAYPYQQFGTLNATVRDVAVAPLSKAEDAGSKETTYQALAVLDARSQARFQRAGGLRPGMTLSGRIVTRRQSLIEWLFGPLLSLESR